MSSGAIRPDQAKAHALREAARKLLHEAGSLSDGVELAVSNALVGTMVVWRRPDAVTIARFERVVKEDGRVYLRGNRVEVSEGYICVSLDVVIDTHLVVMTDDESMRPTDNEIEFMSIMCANAVVGKSLMPSADKPKRKPGRPKKRK